jgi:cysteine desulfurase
MVYFDHNATSPLHPAARRAWLDAVERWIGNPSSPHRLGQRAEAALAEAREKLAALLGCGAGEIVWTSGATEAANLAIHHVAQTLDPAAEVWVSAVEHPAVLEPVRHYLPRHHQLIPVTRAGAVDAARLKRELTRTRPALVIVMAANNETGVLQPWREVCSLCRQREVPFLCDATQWLGRLSSQSLGQCDYVLGSAHKLGGPRGVGFLKCPGQVRLHSLIVGGRQEDGRRAGTENVAGVLAMVAAAEARESVLRQSGAGVSPGVGPPGPVAERLGWRHRFETRLSEAVGGVEVVGVRRDRLWNTVMVIMPGVGSQSRWVVKLDKLGFAVSTGSACSSGREQPSHVLTAMGYSGEQAGRALRFSSGWETSPDEWDGLLNALAEVGRKMASRNPTA